MPVSNISADAACFMVGQLGMQNRTADLKDAGKSIQDAQQQKEAMHQAIKKLGADAEAIEADVNRHRGGLDKAGQFFGHFLGGNRADHAKRDLQKNAAETQKMQQTFSEKKEQLEKLQRDAKDIHEAYDSTNQVYQDMVENLNDAASSLAK